MDCSRTGALPNMSTFNICTDRRELGAWAARPLHLASGQRARLRLLEAQDGRRLSDYFAGLSEETRGYFSPHPLDGETAQRLCAAVGQDEALRYVATVSGEDGERVIAYLILQLGIPEDERGRCYSSGTPLDPQLDCTFAASLADGWQGQQLGDLLMAPLIAVSLRLERRYMVLLGGTQGRSRGAIRFYQRWGFRTVGRFEHPRGRMNCDMVLPLGHVGATNLRREQTAVPRVAKPSLQSMALA
jgi:GNAT superfamily N-acetyltransferase